MIRVLDIFISLVGLILFLPVLTIVYVICWFDTGYPIFAQRRLGQNESIFTIYKFRTMCMQAESLPTHDSDKTWITSLGGFLRRTKLDELPQLVNVLLGQMSLVGPRPGLPDHEALILARREFGIYDVRPGITGPAQIEGINMSRPVELARRDMEWLENVSVSRYFGYLLKTLF